MKNNVSTYIHNIVLGSKRTVVAAALTCLVVAAVSCRSVRTVTVEVPVPVHDTTYVAKVEHDSVFVENVVTEYAKGDTVFLTRTVTKYVERLKTDTIRVFVEKPIEIVKTEEKIVEKPRSWVEKTLMFMGFVMFAGILLFVSGLALKTRRE